MHDDALQPFRDTVDGVGACGRASFARAARNAVASAIITASLAPEAGSSRPEHEPPEAEIMELLGADRGGALTALYRGGEGWTGRAIDLLEPLNALARVE